MEAQETRRDTFVLCGEKIDARNSKQPKSDKNVNGKSDCQKTVAEPKTVTEEFLKSI